MRVLKVIRTGCILASVLSISAACSVDDPSGEVFRRNEAVRASARANVINSEDVQTILDSLVLDNGLLHCTYVRCGGEWLVAADLLNAHEDLLSTTRLVAVDDPLPLHVRPSGKWQWVNDEWLLPVFIRGETLNTPAVLCVVSLDETWVPVSEGVALHADPLRSLMATKTKILDHYLLADQSWRSHLSSAPVEGCGQ